MTPVEEARAAAAKLRETAKPLLNTAEEPAWRDFFTRHGADLGLTSEDEAWIALARPELAEPLAGLLEEIADWWATFRLTPGDDHPALIAARLINKGGAR